MTHDKFCEYDGEITYPCGQCATIAAARADEREQAAQRILIRWSYSEEPHYDDGCGMCEVVIANIAAARGEDEK